MTTDNTPTSQPDSPTELTAATENASTARPDPSTDLQPGVSLTVAAEKEASNRPDPSIDLQPGGFLEQVLERSRSNERGDADLLREELSADLKRLRDALDNVRYRISSGLERSDLDVARMLVAFPDERYRANAVLRFCLGLRWNVEDKESKLRQVALEKYQNQPSAYDQILGDLIPAEFRKQGHTKYAENCFDAGTYNTAADDWPVYLARLKHRRGHPLVGLSTGLPSLDLALRGLHGLNFLGGGTGVGKSTLALFIAVHALKKHLDLGVLFYSLDMPKTVLFDRLLCQETGVEYANLITTEPGDKGLKTPLEEADRRLNANVLPRLRIVEHLFVPKGKDLTQVVKDDLNQLAHSTAVMDTFIVVDYFQLLPVPEEIRDGVDADFYRVKALQQVQQWSRTNQNPAGVPILAISEVRKGESGRTEISIGDLMGSARLGYSAETVLLLEPSKDANDGSAVPVKLNVAKARDGAVRSKINLLFDHTRSQFREALSPRGSKKGNKTKEQSSPQPRSSDTDPYTGLEG